MSSLERRLARLEEQLESVRSGRSNGRVNWTPEEEARVERFHREAFALLDEGKELTDDLLEGMPEHPKKMWAKYGWGDWLAEEKKYWQVLNEMVEEGFFGPYDDEEEGPG